MHLEGNACYRLGNAFEKKGDADTAIMVHNLLIP